jgi:hypothetical protein
MVFTKFHEIYCYPVALCGESLHRIWPIWTNKYENYGYNFSVRPEVNYDYEWADFHEINACCTNFFEECYFVFRLLRARN